MGWMVRPTRVSKEILLWTLVARDPKVGELGPSRVRSEETLMEARSDTDVQIVRLTRV